MSSLNVRFSGSFTDWAAVSRERKREREKKVKRKEREGASEEREEVVAAE